MSEDNEVIRLREKIAALETKNRELLAAQKSTQKTSSQTATARSKARLRSATALILLIVTALFAPVAVLGSWIRAELVDTDRFVQTFAPLSEKPEMQEFVAAEVSASIKDSVDIDGMVGALFDGLAAMELPAQATAMLPLLKGPTVSGVESLVDTGVAKLVESPQFGSAWETALRETHSRSIAIIQGDPNALLQLDDDGTISLSLREVTAQVKNGLADQGIGFAAGIPEIDRMIPLVSSESLVLVRTAYQLAVSIGFWLPWLVAATFIAGVLIARDRVRTLARGSLGVAVSLLLSLAGVGIGRMVFVGAVSPSIMPAATADVLFAQLTELIASTLVALAVLFLVLAIGAWVSGSSKLAVSVRTAFSDGFTAARRALDSRGMQTGSFGRAIDHWRLVITVVTVLLGVVLLFFMRPITTGGVFIVVLSVLGVLLIVELLRRPAVPVQAKP